MRARILAVRAPFLATLALLLTILIARSSLAWLAPFDLAAFPYSALLLLAVGLLLLPAFLARETPLPAAAFVTAPILAASAYGASRLDWLRVLKDFGVAEENALDWTRLALSLLALVTLWGLHAADLATRLHADAIARGIAPQQAAAAAKRSTLRTTQAAALALAGTLGLIAVALGAAFAGASLPAERAALLAPLVVAILLAAAGLYLARTRTSG